MNNDQISKEELANQNFHSGAVKRDKGLYEESIVDFLQALSINPNHVAANYQMIYSLSSLNRQNEALIYANKIVELAPSGNTYEQRAFVKEALGDFDGAKEDTQIAWSIPKEDCWC